MDKVWDTLRETWQADKGKVSPELLKQVYDIQFKHQFEPDRGKTTALTKEAVQRAIERMIRAEEGSES